MRIEELRSLSLFDGLTDEQLRELIEGSEEVSAPPGAELFVEGEHAETDRFAGVVPLVGASVSHDALLKVPVKGTPAAGLLVTAKDC